LEGGHSEIHWNGRIQHFRKLKMTGKKIMMFLAKAAKNPKAFLRML
jgi:aspartate oxidase